MVTRTKLTKRGKAVWCALCAIAITLAPLLGAMLTPSSATNEAQADEPSTQALEPIDYKPRLYKMLAINNHIDTAHDELRMDFVLRVAHGQVNPVTPTSCAPGISSAGRSCGLKLFYQPAASPTAPLWEPDYIYALGNGLLGAAGALAWAQNMLNSYTIHNIVNSGVYDYLTISLEGGMALSNTVNQSAIGGVTTPQYVYAQIGDVGSGWTVPVNRVEANNWTNLTADYPAQVYDDICGGNGVNAQCNGPRAFVGYDGSPGSWLLTGGQPNWGLMTDVGIDVVSGTPISAGTAPPKSFFVYWYNPWFPVEGSLLPPYNTQSCSRNTSFYFQWLGLKGGKDWVPVNDLTPTAQRVDGQVPEGITPFTGAPAGSAFNVPTVSGHDIRSRGSGGSMSLAQNLDGTIDFAQAKADQPELDGYFKLVTWPITTNPAGSTDDCVASNMVDAYNPLVGQPTGAKGVTAGMPQSTVNTLINKGWTIDTAYYKYKLPVVQPPVITKPDNDTYSPTIHPTISGTGEPGHIVYLYAEDPANPIDPSDPDNPDTRGRYIGQATVGSDSKWSIVDNDNTVTDGYVNYHAWQAEQTSGYGITSGFSNIQKVNFGTDPAPVVNPVVTVPHTKRAENGQLEASAKVHISGTAAPLTDDTTLKVYASHATTANVSTVAATPPSETDLISECTQTLDDAGSQSWSCDVSPSYFLDQTSSGETYLFRARLVNSANVESGFSIQTNVVTVDMTSTQIAISNTSDYQTLRGTGYTLPAGSTGDLNAVMIVKWPDNTESHPVVAADGTWSVDVPSSMTTSGTVYVTADDTETNEAGWVSYYLNVVPPAVALPFAGERSRTVPIVAALVAAMLAIAMILYLCIGHAMKQGKAGDDP
ncbi:hypothetical protein OZX73_02885 [Bifidobacterium sp. ESL0775]|uniref:hypothetical protein n=1 Tax=Bifidobacterium sp. ESL0775 TaxID=2983230 RepID=UPI0023F8AC8D|nr:hypothetical protein [Bifidobacterium sp. ESL0775]WEV69829.1 hypothetical protein OZX73_02885 [Bifidobacterium sp. ESL0775]